MAKHDTKTLVYHNGGDTFLGEYDSDKNTQKGIDAKAKEAGQVGCLYGHTDMYGPRTNVIVFFQERPDAEEIERRRHNGLKAARWGWL